MRKFSVLKYLSPPRFLPSGSGVGALRGLRIIVKLLRVARAAKMLVKNEAVALLVKTITESSETIVILSGFSCFLLLIFTIIAGHTMGRCHLNDDDSINPDPEVSGSSYAVFSSCTGTAEQLFQQCELSHHVAIAAARAQFLLLRRRLPRQLPDNDGSVLVGHHVRLR